MIKQLVICIVVAFLVMGCASGHEYTDYAQSVATSNRTGQDALTSYFNKKAIDNQGVFKALAGNGDPAQAQNNQMAIVLYTILSQQSDTEVLKYFQPQYVQKPTTNADIGMNLAGNFLPTLVKWGAGAYLGNKIINGLGTTSQVLGAGASINTQAAGNDINSGIQHQFNNPGNDLNNGFLPESVQADEFELSGTKAEPPFDPDCSDSSKLAGICS